jgi:hypothetical protein
LHNSLIDQNIEKDSRAAYRNRFYYAPWQQVLDAVQQTLGTASFGGLMKFFHKRPAKLVSPVVAAPA